MQSLYRPRPIDYHGQIERLLALDLDLDKRQFKDKRKASLRSRSPSRLNQYWTRLLWRSKEPERKKRGSQPNYPNSRSPLEEHDGSSRYVFRFHCREFELTYSLTTITSECWYCSIIPIERGVCSV
jgi:hypothetical protein